ncbi:hypothetical protein EX30DRAFT_185658 [Ascodesmis nigricans]|uniref:Uncharacterized protein n=1 Tax=Ascodesmis nigricans TaxID=341454 RepID=A0A4S2N046_9PEZI|nr:hypothetical protein EX30DRAFT_185658 [Ascodesmis nigricans]
MVSRTESLDTTLGIIAWASAPPLKQIIGKDEPSNQCGKRSDGHETWRQQRGATDPRFSTTGLRCLRRYINDQALFGKLPVKFAFTYIFSQHRIVEAQQVEGVICASWQRILTRTGMSSTTTPPDSCCAADSYVSSWAGLTLTPDGFAGSERRVNLGDTETPCDALHCAMSC